MGRLRQGTLVWLGSILAGFGLGAYVLLAWPEPETRVVRLPYGESLPKTPNVAVARRAPVVKTVASAAGVVTPPQAQPAAEQQEEESLERELAGPPPVASDLESDGFRQETPEELGAKPLPGMDPAVPTP